jgi:hypothetical protein
MLGLQHHTDPLRFQFSLQPVGDLGRQTLLDLQVPCEQLEDTPELAEADDPIGGADSRCARSRETGAGDACTANGTESRGRRSARRNDRHSGMSWLGTGAV